MRCRGMHCTGCADRGGWGLALALAVAIIVIGAVIARPAAHAAEDVLRVAAEVLKITVIVLASAIGLAVLAGLTLLGTRIRRHQIAQPRRTAVIPLPANRSKASTTARQLPSPPGPQQPASPLHLHLHGVTAQDVAELLTRHDAQDWP